MLQRTLLVIAVFLILLVALSLGESVGRQTLDWVSRLTYWMIGDLRELYTQIVAYLQVNRVKALIALLLTIPVSYWLIRRPGADTPAALSTRKMAIVLALFLGWLGAHRFYLGQIGWGLLYLVIAYLFTPLAVVIGLIDAARFTLMSEAAFPSRRPAPAAPPSA